MKNCLISCSFLISVLSFAEVVDPGDLDLYTDQISINSMYGDEDEYEKREYLGWDFYIKLELLDTKKKKAEATYLLYTSQLNHLKNILPVKIMEKLEAENVKIVITDDCGDGQCFGLQVPCKIACYVSRAPWLEDFYSKTVLIRDLDTMLNVNAMHPHVLLHEIAHAFHNLIIPDGYADQTIKDAYQKMIDSGEFRLVNHLRTGDNQKTPKRRPYMLTNELEFFAEISEALWIRNEYEPFVFQQVFANEILTNITPATEFTPVQKQNPVWDAWWDHSGPHEKGRTWYWQTLAEEDEESSFDTNLPELPNLFDLDHKHE